MKQRLTGGTVSGVAKAPPPTIAYPKVGRGPTAPPPGGGRFSSIRLKSDMMLKDPQVYTREQYKTGGDRGIDRELAKDELAKTMEYHGKGAAQRQEDREWYERKKAREEAGKAPKMHPITDKDAMIDEILGAISERQQFLVEMTDLGQGDKYQAQIKTEVAQKMALLRSLGVETGR